MRVINLISISIIALLLISNRHATASQNINSNAAVVLAQKLDASQIKIDLLEKEVKDLLNVNKNLQEELSTSKLSRDIAKQEANNAHKELNQMQSTTLENQTSMDNILNELQATKKTLANVIAINQSLNKAKSENEKNKNKPVQNGDLVIITPEVIPAKPINLQRVTPKVKKRHGIVVVNILINENGDVLDAKLLQGLPGHDALDIAHMTCIEQAKRIIFDPARTLDGKTKVCVWQGVGFYLE